MRFYARHQNPTFRSDVDKQNWLVCDSALKELGDKDQELILAIYRERDTIPDNIYSISIAQNINQDAIWKLVNDFEYKVAKKRGLR